MENSFKISCRGATQKHQHVQLNLSTCRFTHLWGRRIYTWIVRIRQENSPPFIIVVQRYNYTFFLLSSLAYTTFNSKSFYAKTGLLGIFLRSIIRQNLVRPVYDETVLLQW